MEQAVKLKLEAWLELEEKEVEECLNSLKHRLGTYRCETDKTYNFMEGYLAAIKTAIRRELL
jgi:hypothetical protein